MEFEKRERHLSSGEPISEVDVTHVQNGGEAAPAVDGLKVHSVIITLKDGIGNLARVMRAFEVSRSSNTKGTTRSLDQEAMTNLP